MSVKIWGRFRRLEVQFKFTLFCTIYSSSLEVDFPHHDLSDAGSNPADVVEFLRTEKFREQVLREGLQAV
jgi:hypothetical protein